MTFAAECIDDLAEAIGDNPVTIKKGALEIQGVPGAVDTEAMFVSGAVEQSVDLSIVVKASDAARFDNKDAVIVTDQAGVTRALRILHKKPDQLGITTTLLLGSQSKGRG